MRVRVRSQTYPISVAVPMELTTATHCPFLTAVPENSMQCFSLMGQAGLSPGCVCLFTSTLSPVSSAWSSCSVSDLHGSPG